MVTKSCKKKKISAIDLVKKKMAHNNHSHKFKNGKNDQILFRNIYTVSLIASPNFNGKSAHKSESRLKKSFSPRAFGVENQANERYVTFQLPQSTSRGNIKHSRISQKSGFSSDYEVTALDHQIGDHGGTTSTLDYLPHRLRLTKEKKPEKMKLDSEMADLGIDSLMSLELAREIESIFNCILDQTEKLQATSLRPIRYLRVERFGEGRG